MKKRQDFGSTDEGNKTLKTVAHSNKNEQPHTYHRNEAGTRPRTTIDFVKKDFYCVLYGSNKGLLAYKLFCLSTVLFVSFLVVVQISHK